jgi:Bacterial archaeo-eukaryotic release factor family 3
MFSRSDLEELVKLEGQPAISIYLPTHLAGWEVRQDPIRLKNLLSAAAKRLMASRRLPEINALLSPAQRLVEDGAFWRRQQHEQQGLAIFLAPGFDRVFQLPIAVHEEIMLGSYFHIKPLLPILEDAGPFWLLTISASHARLYEGSRWDFTEVTELDLPQGVDRVEGMTEYEENYYASPVGRHGGLAKAQSFGDDPDQVRKEELLEFLHRIVPPVEPFIKRRSVPVILAAAPEIQGHFRWIAGWKEIHPHGLSENPEALTNEELHRRAYALVEQGQIAARNTALERLNARLSTGKASTKPEELVKAARYARVDTLFLSGDEHLWGIFDEVRDRVEAHCAAAEDDIDLFDYAALMTLRHGGSVIVVDGAALPPPGLSAAILRY